MPLSLSRMQKVLQKFHWFCAVVKSSMLSARRGPQARNHIKSEFRDHLKG
jgi:hypothetical protein